MGEFGFCVRLNSTCTGRLSGTKRQFATPVADMGCCTSRSYSGRCTFFHPEQVAFIPSGLGFVTVENCVGMRYALLLCLSTPMDTRLVWCRVYVSEILDGVANSTSVPLVQGYTR